MPATAFPYWTTNLVPVPAYPSYPDGSADFSAGGGFLSLAGGLPLPPSGAFSVAWWWVFDAGSATPNLFQWGNLVDETGAAGDQIRFAFEGGLGVSRDLMWASDGSTSSNGGGGDHIGLPWRFQVVEYDPSTFPPNPTMRQSVNNGLLGTNAAATALMRAATPATSWWVGQGPVAANWGFHPGRFDAMAIYAGALSKAEIGVLWNGGLGFNLPSQVPAGSIAPPLIAWYPFDEPSGAAVWQDASGNARHLNATGNVVHGGPRNT